MATGFRATYEGDEDTLTVCRDTDGETIVETRATGRPGTFIRDMERQLARLGWRVVGRWWAPGYEPGQIGCEGGPDEIECYVEPVN